MLLQLPEFKVYAPATLAKACSLLARLSDDAQVLAGGIDLLFKMKLRRLVPSHLASRCLGHHPSNQGFAGNRPQVADAV